MAETRQLKVRDRRNRGWFYLDNEYLNGYAKIFGAVGTAIYVSLCRHADSDQKCFPSQELIGQELNIHPRTVIRYLKEFVKYRLVEIQRERKDGKWISNTYWLLDKSEWVSHDTKSHGHQVTLKTPSSDTRYNDHVTQSHTKDTKGIKKTKEEYNTAETSSAGLVPEVIKLFEAVNPACKKYYGNTTQRKACENLLETYGLEELNRVIAFLPKSNKMAYMPTIQTPLHLWEKYQALKDGLQRKKSELSTKGKGLA